MPSKKLQKIIDDDKHFLFQNYGDRQQVCFTRGDGSYLFDQDNRKYIDFFSGIATSSLGYGHPAFTRKMHAQLDRIIHSSNHFYNREQVQAAKLVSQLSFPGRTMFVNSGAEANEAALKLVRRHGQSIASDRYEIISFEDSFHGRTFGSMSATGNEKIRSGFGPLVPGFIFLPFNDTARFKAEIERNGRVCAVITELIQGEGGINLANKDFIAAVFEICAARKILTIVDEVQTGIGRTGRMFVYQHFGIRPDIITLAKGLGGGVPIGALHARSDLASFFQKGVHGTTFGGNHLACAAACAALSEIRKRPLLSHVQRSGAFITNRLHSIKEKVPYIREIRGMGLHIGIELDRPGGELVRRALKKGLVINCTSEKVIRIMPPLTIPSKTIMEGLALLEETFLEEGGQA